MQEMLVIAASVGTATATLATVLIYWQIRERRITGHALQNVEARVGGLLESAMDAIVTVDEQQYIVQYNAAAEKVFLWPREAMLGQSLEKLIPQRFRGDHRDHVERFGKTGVTSRRMGDRTVVTGLRANGEEFPIEASISQLDEDGHKLFTVILRDITERARAEQQQVRSEARLRGILDSAMDAIITVDEYQHIVLFNTAAEAVFGCPRDEAIGAPLTWFIPERFRAAHGEHLKRFGEAGTSSRRMGPAQRIVMGLRRNGEEFPIEASISQINEGGEKFYTVILRDVTERVRAEDALRRYREELNEFAAAAQSIREQEKSRVARELHDELAQALTALKMDVTWLTERLPAGQDMLAQKLDKMQVILDGSVTATRRIAADLRPLILDDLGLVPAAEWLVQNFRERNGIDCELMIADDELNLPDPYATTVFRILQESLANIAKHARASLVEITICREDGEAKLAVRDNGRGFVTTDPRKPDAYGLMGLRERAYLVGGEVLIDSAPGRGTAINVRLPIIEPGVPS
jgi:PAS domain S-box-containing protein